MQAHGFDVVNGYLVLRAGALRALLVTGSPFTFGVDGVADLLCRTRSPHHAPGGPVTLSEIGRCIGACLDVVVGSDVLSQRFEVDWRGRTLTFDPEGADEGIRLPLESATGLPLIRATVLGRERRLLVDTGATVSLMRAEVFRGMRAIGTQTLFNPILGGFAADIYQAPALVGGEEVPIVWGSLPPSLAVLSLMADGIIGTQLLERFRARFDMAAGALTLAAY